MIKRISSLICEIEHNGTPMPAHWCVPCNTLHMFAVDKPFKNGSQWTYNNNPECPSFSPSMNITVGPYIVEGGGDRVEICHYFLTDGNIQYLSDCTHEIAGKTVQLTPINYKRFGIL